MSEMNIPGGGHRSNIPTKKELVSKKKLEGVGIGEIVLGWFKGVLGGVREVERSGAETSRKVGGLIDNEVDASLLSHDVVEGKAEDVEPAMPEKILYTDEKVQKAAVMVDAARESLEREIIDSSREAFVEFWDTVNGHALDGKSFEVLNKKFGRRWNGRFERTFEQVWGHVGGGLERVSVKDRETAAFGIEVRVKSDDAYYDEYKLRFGKDWAERKAHDVGLSGAVALLDKAKAWEEYEHGVKVQEIKDGKHTSWLRMSERQRKEYEGVLNNVKLHDYSPEEVEVARHLARKAGALIKKHFGGRIDREAWAQMVTREPLLGKAVMFLLQERYDRLGFEFEREALQARIDKGEFSPEELVQKKEELGRLGELKSAFSLFFQTLAPWNQIDGSKRLRANPKEVEMQVLPFGEVGDMLEVITGGKEKDVLGKTIPEFVQEKIFKPIDDRATEIVGELQEAGADVVKDIKGKGLGLNQLGEMKGIALNKLYDLSEEGLKARKARFIVRDLTHQSRENWVKRGVTGLLQKIVDRPQDIKSKKWIPWLGRYGKRAMQVGAVGAGVGFIKGLTSFSIRHILDPIGYIRQVLVKTAIGGAIGASLGIFIERFKGQLKTFATMSIPGAVGALGAVIAIAGTISTGGLLLVGLAAVLTGIFGVWFFYHTDTGQRLLDKFQRIVWSQEVRWFDQWGEKLKIAETGRKVFEEVAQVASVRQKDMGRQIEIAEDIRYQNLVKVCEANKLSSMAREAFLEAVRKTPRLLGDPQGLSELNERFPRKIREELEMGILLPEGGVVLLDKVVEEYAQLSAGALKVGLEGRFEDLINLMHVMHPMLPHILRSLNDNPDLFEDDEILIKFLKAEGLNSEAVDKVYGVVTKVRGEVAPKKSSFAKIINFMMNGSDALPEVKDEDIARFQDDMRVGNIDPDQAVVQVVMVMRGIFQKRLTLENEGALKQLFVDAGLEGRAVDEMFEAFDERRLARSPREARAVAKSDKATIESALETSSVQDMLLSEYLFNEGFAVDEADGLVELLPLELRNEILAKQNAAILQEYSVNITDTKA